MISLYACTDCFALYPRCGSVKLIWTRPNFSLKKTEEEDEEEVSNYSTL